MFKQGIFILKASLTRLRAQAQIKSQYTVYLYALLVGVLTGLATTLFIFILRWCEQWVLQWHPNNYQQAQTIHLKLQAVSQAPLKACLIVLLPALGGFLSGLITHYFTDKLKGVGTDDLIHSFHHNAGKIDVLAPVFKAIATIFTISSGGSGGKEGPISQIGAGIGVWTSNFANAGARARRTLLLAGTAAGLGAVFKAPLSGALTATEMVYTEDIESDALIPCFISSVSAYLVYVLFMGHQSYMTVGNIPFLNYRELLFYILLGGCCFVFGYIFISGFRSIQNYFTSLTISPLLKPTLGGLLVGVITLFFYEILGTGNHYLQSTFLNPNPGFFSNGLLSVALSFLIIAILKILATSLTLGSGGSGGIFGPSLFIGAMLGAAVGALAKFYLPNIQVSIASFMVIGMGAFYAGVANAPIAGFLLVCEMTGSYILIAPLILVSLFTFILSKKISFYKNKLTNRFKSPAHSWDIDFDLIDNIYIHDKFKNFRQLAILTNSHTLAQAEVLAAELEAKDFIVTDDDNHYAGIFSFRKMNPDLPEWKNKQNLIQQLTDPNVPSISAKQTLNKALHVIIQFGVDKVAITHHGKVQGYIRSRDIFAAYTEAVEKRKLN